MQNPVAKVGLINHIFCSFILVSLLTNGSRGDLKLNPPTLVRDIQNHVTKKVSLKVQALRLVSSRGSNSKVSMQQPNS